VLPLDRVATLTLTEGPSTIQREWGRRRTVVQCNVAGRDVAGFVAEAKAALARELTLPEGYVVDWGGQFENMERANRRLLFVVPLALGLIFILLYFSLRSMRDVLIVATGIPLGAVGGVLALWLRGLPFTVSAGIGFVALSGVAILNGLVLVTFIQQRLAAGTPLVDAVREGCLVRLAAGADDRAGRRGRLHPHGVQRRGGGRGAAPAGHRGPRRHRHQHAAHPARAARADGVVGAGEGGGVGKKTEDGGRRTEDGGRREGRGDGRRTGDRPAVQSSSRLARPCALRTSRGPARLLRCPLHTNPKDSS
jgi:hypothetical protein